MTVERTNHAFQVGAQCGLHVCHYVEDSIRSYLGQGRATQGWPDATRMRTVREHLHKASLTLSKACEKWGDERFVQLQVEKERLAATAEAARKKLEALGKLEALAKVQNRLADALVNEGAAESPPPFLRVSAARGRLRPRPRARRSLRSQPLGRTRSLRLARTKAVRKN